MKLVNLFENRPDETEIDFCGRTLVLNHEHSLKLYGDNGLLHSFVCSPSELGELCIGWLCSEGYTAESVQVAKDGLSATARGAVSPTPPEPLPPVCANATTEEMLTLFRGASDKHARSHGIHECVIKGSNWHIIRTDIGRHNAIDKAIGAAVLAGYDLEGATLFSSGRINRQTVEKAARCKLGCLMSKAVITREALTLAEELGLNVLFSVK